MAELRYEGSVIAVIWDFDGTLIPGYQQAPLFARFHIEPAAFWAEVNGLTSHYAKRGVVVSADTIYLNHILTYVQQGRFPGLNNAMLRSFGEELTFYPGMPEFLERSTGAIEGNALFKSHKITVEHYIVSTGLRQIMLGSAAAQHVVDIWGNDFIEAAAEPGFLVEEGETEKAGDVITQVGYFLDNTTKTRAIWEINKGCNKYPDRGVNDFFPEEERPVPLRNMIYIADGLSDVPVFSILNQYGGRTLGVHDGTEEHFRKVRELLKQGRVQHLVRADYAVGSPAEQWIMAELYEMAEIIVSDQEARLRSRIRRAPGH